MEQRPRRSVKRLVKGGFVAAVLAAGGAASFVAARPAGPPAAYASAPPGVRIRVQVLNATQTRGLARRATVFLRDRGFDVVEVATAHGGRDSTLVLDRSGRADWAQLVARALGAGRVESRPDSSRYLDVTVLVGRDWTPPAKPFHP